jgi:hypothetical protein
MMGFAASHDFFEVLLIFSPALPLSLLLMLLVWILLAVLLLSARPTSERQLPAVAPTANIARGQLCLVCMDY